MLAVATESRGSYCHTFAKIAAAPAIPHAAWGSLMPGGLSGGGCGRILSALDLRQSRVVTIGQNGFEIIDASPAGLKYRAY